MGLLGKTMPWSSTAGCGCRAHHAMCVCVSLGARLGLALDVTKERVETRGIVMVG